ncbi:unnamed protein product [Clonostachys rhizophaga]|uniref:Uncharacterized protein n=1 Tax=Clonostachys rhizophaga TaxID=160324 RepID=A0A9N9YGC5_9HYPO|nr:unnamed protein product [Clonostachys rhizophaga]
MVAFQHLSLSAAVVILAVAGRALTAPTNLRELESRAEVASDSMPEARDVDMLYENLIQRRDLETRSRRRGDEKLMDNMKFGFKDFIALMGRDLDDRDFDDVLDALVQVSRRDRDI